MRRGATTVAWALGSGIILAVLVVLVAWLIEPEPVRSRTRHRDVDVTDLVTPGELTDEERMNTGNVSQGSAITLEDGAWVQVADEDGRLAQQYSAERIDPMPDGWLEMVRPRAMMFLENGRVVTMRGEHGLLDVPQQAISSGSLDGDVVIRLFVPRDGKPIDIAESEPEVIVRTQEASFDNELGEIRCPREIRIDSRDASFEGSGLTMLLGSSGRTIERLVVDQSTAPIRFLMGAREEEGAPASGGVVPAGDPPDRTDSAEGASVEVPLFYELELERNVRIARFASTAADQPISTINGERLVAIFSLDGDGFEQSIAARDLPAVSSNPLSREAFISAAVLAQADEDRPTSEFIEIEYDGRMIMRPVDAGRNLSSKDDFFLEIHGGERPVVLNDTDSQATATCKELQYETSGDVARLIGTTLVPLFIEAPGLELHGERFVFERTAGTGGLVGPGVMHLAGSEADSSSIGVAWQERVDLAFVPGTEVLERATFREQVHVDGDEFYLHSSGLEVRFAGSGASGRDSVENIIATGTSDDPVMARRKGDQGLLSAERIDLKIDLDGDGRSVPTSMLAEGDVRAQDEQQTLWSDALEVDFAPESSSRSDEESIVLEKIVATNGVQVLLADGARVWADSLRGSGMRRELTLASEDDSLVIVRGNVLTDKLRQVRFDDRSRTARAGGPGRFRYFEEPVKMPATGRISFDQVYFGRPSVEATWSDGMEYDDAANDGAGALELHGGVVIRNQPDAMEENDLDAEDLRIDFVERDRVPVIDSEGNPVTEDDLMAFSGSRDMRLLTALGDARLESRSWPDESHQGDPDLFQITGDDVRYDAVTAEGGVRGSGTLLVNRLPTSGESVDDAQAIGISLGGDGTTRFSWKQGMSMTHQVATRYLINMKQGVEILHAGVQPRDTMTLSADTLEVLVDRPMSGSSSTTELDLGGQAEILRVTAGGRVYVRTPDQDVECEIFDYDASSQIARLSARQGRLVTILGKDAVAPIRAEAITWDMRSGRMQITGARGGAGR